MFSQRCFTEITVLQRYFQWIIFFSFLHNLNCFEVPDIVGCNYIDAYAVDCWWKRPPMNNSNIRFRLKYKKLADAKPLQLIHECSPNKISINSQGIYLESCSIKGIAMFAKLIFFLIPTCTNESENVNCNSTVGKEFHFKCKEENVVLQAPPIDLRMELSSKLLWNPPMVKGSMLPYVMANNHIVYNLTYKVGNDIESANTSSYKDWQDWYLGRKPAFILPPLLPNRHYVVRVTARLETQGGDSTWSCPSESIEFNGSSIVVNRLAHFDTTPENSSERKDVQNVKEIRKQLSLWIIVSALSIAVFAIMFCVVVKKKPSCCHLDMKIPKPILMTSISEMNNIDAVLQDNAEIIRGADVMTLPERLLIFAQHNRSENVVKHYGQSNRDIGNRHCLSRQHSIRCKSRVSVREGNENLLRETTEATSPVGSFVRNQASSHSNAMQCSLSDISMNDYSTFDNQIRREESASIDYVTESRSLLSAQPRFEMLDEDRTPQRSALLSKSVHQKAIFPKFFSEDITNNTTTSGGSPSNHWSDPVVCACAEAAERIQNLYEHMKLQNSCTFCEKDFSKTKSCGNFACPTHDLQSTHVAFAPYDYPDASSLDSGFSPETSTRT